nr:hypothetical protein [Tanacetum cinerariifolium]
RKNRRHGAGLQKVRFAERGGVVVGLEVAVGGHAAGVHHALRNALVVEVRHLLAEQEVFEQRGAALAAFQRVLVVVDAQALVAGQVFAVAFVTVLGHFIGFGVAHHILVVLLGQGFFFVGHDNGRE